MVDEAHCVSEWSHNFRPAYHRLGRVLRSRLRVRGPVLALTATATKRTETSLRSTLDIPEEGAFRDDAIRANLTLSAMRVPASAREATLKHLLQREPMRGVGSAIVYVAFQNQAETVAAYLQTNGVNAKAYHAGQEPKDRQRTQAQFFAGSVRVVVATVAFGMGLDKADVRAVINYSLPRSPEAYIQQAGRAGRDGLPARCVSFIDADDFTRLRSLSFSDGVDRAAVHKAWRRAVPRAGTGRRGARSPRSRRAEAGPESRAYAEGGPEKFGLGLEPERERKSRFRERSRRAHGGGRFDRAAARTRDGHARRSHRDGAFVPRAVGRAGSRAAVRGGERKRDEEQKARRSARATPPRRKPRPARVQRRRRTATTISAREEMETVWFAFCRTCARRASCRSTARRRRRWPASCPLVAAVLALGAKPKAGTYRFSVAAAARSMRSGLEEVGAQLQALSANGDAAYRLSDRAVGYEILRAPPADLRPLASALAAHLAAVERSAVHKLDMGRWRREARATPANAEVGMAQARPLRGTLEAYLLHGTGPGSAGRRGRRPLGRHRVPGHPAHLAADEGASC